MTETRVVEITEAGFGPFFGLMGEVEAGRHFDPASAEHVAWLRDCISKHYGHGTRFFGLYDGEKPLGILGLRIETYLNTPWSLGFITDLGVFAELRGRGYGSRLLDFATEEARRQNCYCLYVDTYAANHRNVALYTRRGFVPVATIPDMNGPGDEGQVWMRKIIGRTGP